MTSFIRPMRGICAALLATVIAFGVSGAAFSFFLPPINIISTTGGLPPNAYNAVANWSTSKYLSRTPGSNGSATKATLSLWLKRSSTGSVNGVMAQDTSGAGLIFWPRIEAGNTISMYLDGAGTTHASSGTYTSTSTWYHVVWAIDTTQATAANRNRIYVNGAEVSYGDSNAWSLSAAVKMNQTTNPMRFGASTAVGISGKVAHVQWVDGAQLTPSDFSQAGVGGTVPKKYTGSFGANGWVMDFANTGSLGADTSGNGNNLTVTGLVSGDASAENVFY